VFRVAAVHILHSVACFKLQKAGQADVELNAGPVMMDACFGKKFEMGNGKAGRLGGWIMNPIFLREAEKLGEESGAAAN